MVYTFRMRASRALHALRERSRASGGDGSDEAALAVLHDGCGGEWQGALESMNQWDNAGLANFLVADAIQACWPKGANEFLSVTVEELWDTARSVTDRLHEEFGRSEAAELFFMDAVEAALREDGAGTFRLVSAAIAKWRSLS